MKVLVCGSRFFDAEHGRERVRSRLDQLLPEKPLLIVGGAPGPDEFAREWAVEHNISHLVVYAHWDRDGKKAGILRNLRMLALKPGLVLAFWNGTSRGTKHTVTEAKKRGIAVEVISDK